MIFEQPIGDFFRGLTSAMKGAIAAFKALSPETKGLIADATLVTLGLFGVLAAVVIGPCIGAENC